MLQRSAELNDAYRELEDPWKRTRSLLELRDRGVMDRTKKLSGTFLMEAMELAEQVACAVGEQVEGLRRQLQDNTAHCLQDIRAQVAQGNWEAAAVQLHQSRYQRKALADLEANQNPEKGNTPEKSNTPERGNMGDRS